MKVKELMIPLSDYLRPEMSLKEAVNLLKTCKREECRVGVKGLPVLNSAGRLIGMLSMGDILKIVHPSYLDMMNLGKFTWDGMLEVMAKKVADKKVENIMTRTVLIVNETDPLMECVDLMVKHNVKRLPVTDASGKVIGMIYERDVFFAVVDAMLDK